MIICKNCGDIITVKYCPGCGQKIEKRLTFTTMVDDTLRGVTNADQGALLTIKELFTRPGYMIAEYIAGRRAIHFRPIPLLILLAGVFTLLNTLAKIQAPSNSMFNLTPIKAMIFVPLLALNSWILFRRRYNYIEHIYILTFASIQWQLIMFLLIDLPRYWIPVGEASNWDTRLMTFTAYTIIFALTCWDYMQIFRRNALFVSWRVALIFILTIIWIILIFTIITTLIAMIA